MTSVRRTRASDSCGSSPSGPRLVASGVLCVTILLTWMIRGRDLLLIAPMVIVYNFVSALGEFMFSDLQRDMALRVLGTSAAEDEELQNY